MCDFYPICRYPNIKQINLWIEQNISIILESSFILKDYWRAFSNWIHHVTITLPNLSLISHHIFCQRTYTWCTYRYIHQKVWRYSLLILWGFRSLHSNLSKHIARIITHCYFKGFLSHLLARLASPESVQLSWSWIIGNHRASACNVRELLISWLSLLLEIAVFGKNASCRINMHPTVGY